MPRNGLKVAVGDNSYRSRKSINVISGASASGAWSCGTAAASSCEVSVRTMRILKRPGAEYGTDLVAAEVLAFLIHYLRKCRESASRQEYLGDYM